MDGIDNNVKKASFGERGEEIFVVSEAVSTYLDYCWTLDPI
jgi:hypothetical protein